MTAALSGFGVFQNYYANIVLLALGIFLIAHGIFKLYFKPQVLLKSLIKKWLLKRRWEIVPGLKEKTYKTDYYFVMAVENREQYRVSISRSKRNKGVLVFHSTIQTDKNRDSQFKQFSLTTQNQLVEDIRLFLATKDIPFEGIEWPLDRILIETVLPIDSHISEQRIDDKTKELVFTVVGINAIISKYLGLLNSDRGSSLIESV